MQGVPFVYFPGMRLDCWEPLGAGSVHIIPNSILVTGIDMIPSIIS